MYSYRYMIVSMSNSTSNGEAGSIPTGMYASFSDFVFDTEEQAVSYINSLYTATPTAAVWHGYIRINFVPNTQPTAVPYGTVSP